MEKKAFETVNYANQYSQELAQAYPYILYTSELYGAPNNGRFKFGGGQMVHIPHISTSGAVFVHRDSISGFDRNVSSQFEAKEMTMYREWSTLLDPMDIEQTNMILTIANATRVFNETQKTPEMDANAFRRLWEETVLIRRDNIDDATKLTEQNILSVFDGYLAKMAEENIITSNVICYVTPPIFRMLKTASGITGILNVGANNGAINREIISVDGVKVKQVPSRLMLDRFDFNVGFKPMYGMSKQINMVLVEPSAIIAPILYENAFTSPPTAISKGKWIYYESFFYDLFVLKNRAGGVVINMDQEPIKSPEDKSISDQPKSKKQ